MVFTDYNPDTVTCDVENPYAQFTNVYIVQRTGLSLMFKEGLRIND